MGGGTVIQAKEVPEEACRCRTESLREGIEMNSYGGAVPEDSPLTPESGAE